MKLLLHSGEAMQNTLLQEFGQWSALCIQWNEARIMPSAASAEAMTSNSQRNACAAGH